MSNPDAKKWDELNAKLDREAEEVEATRDAHAGNSRNLFLVAVVMLVAVAVELLVFANNAYIELIVTASGLMMALAIMFGLRNQRMAEQARDDMERIRRDIRKWKKKKPGSTRPEIASREVREELIE